MKKRLISLLLALSVAVSLLCTAAFAAESTGVGITPVTNPDLWTTRLNSQGQTYSYRPPTAAGRQLWCMDLGYSYRYGTESFLQFYRNTIYIPKFILFTALLFIRFCIQFSVHDPA